MKTASELVEELAEAEKAATPGPWKFYPDNSAIGAQVPGELMVFHHIASAVGFENGTLATEAVNALPILLAMAREAIAWRDEYGAGIRGDFRCVRETDRIAAEMGVRVE